MLSRFLQGLLSCLDGLPLGSTGDVTVSFSGRGRWKLKGLVAVLLGSSFFLGFFGTGSSLNQFLQDGNTRLEGKVEQSVCPD